MSTNKNLLRAKSNRNDEFYTLYTDVSDELNHYRPYFVDKIIYCNCDSEKSSFVRYFKNNFKELKLKGLYATEYNQDACGVVYYYDNDTEYKKELVSDGSFDSRDCIYYLEKSDIVVTNPPFSKFSMFFDTLINKEKDFIILGSVISTIRNNVAPYLVSGKVNLGYFYGNLTFLDDNNIPKPVKVTWYTTLPVDRKVDFLQTGKRYLPNVYKKIDGLDCINISNINDIPMDYEGIMAVPITFLHKLNKEQFKIVGLGRYFKDLFYQSYYVEDEEIFTRLFIKKL